MSATAKNKRENVDPNNRQHKSVNEKFKVHRILSVAHYFLFSEIKINDLFSGGLD
jgi:hypothetical protein